MALDGTYTGLKASVADFLNRTNLTAQIPDFIRIAEVRTYRTIRIPPMEVVTTPQTGLTTGRITVPTDFLELKSMVLVTDPPKELMRRPLAEVRALNSPTGRPRAFSRLDQEWIFGPLPDQQYDVEIFYYKELAQLVTTTNETNYFTVSAPDILLFGALREAARFMKDDTEFQRWSQLYRTAVAELQQFSDRAEWAGSRLSERIRT